MPRTKHARKGKPQEVVPREDSDMLIRDFERQANLRISKMEAEAKLAIKGLETFIDVTFSRIPMDIRQMTIGEILSYEADNEKENCNEVSSSVDDCSLRSASTKVKKQRIGKRVTTTSDDGYVTEGVTTFRPSRAAKIDPTPAKRTRSSSRNSKLKFSELNQETAKKLVKKERSKESKKSDKFKTPAPYKTNACEYGLVTPKIKPNNPLNVLRRPRQGEMVLSMQGSPLLVSAVVQEETANINVPLRNGNVISFLPNDGLRMSHIPSLDPETMRQLETLKNHIEKVIRAK